MTVTKICPGRNVVRAPLDKSSFRSIHEPALIMKIIIIINIIIIICVVRQYLPNDYTLVLTEPLHVTVAVVTDGKYVRGQFPDFSIFVQFDLLRRVNGKDLVRVDRHEDRPRVCLKLIRRRQHVKKLIFERSILFSCSFVQAELTWKYQFQKIKKIFYAPVQG